MNPLRNTKLLYWFNFFYGFRLYSVVAILYFSKVTGSYALGISLFSVVQIVQAFLEVPTGIYSDRLSRSTCIKFGSAASVLSIIFYALAHSYLILIVGAIGEGICRALFSGNNDALLYETLDEAGQKDRYPEALGKARSWLELAGFLSATLGGVIAFLSYSYLMWLSVIPQIAALVISFQFAEPKFHAKKSEKIFLHLSDAWAQYKQNPRLRKLSLANIIGIGVGESSWSLQAAFYNSVLPVWAVGFVMSLNFLTSTVSFRLSGAIIKKIKAINLLLYQEVFTRVIDFIALIYPTVLSPFLMAFASVTYGPSVIAQNTLLQAEFSDQQRATIASINSLAASCFFAGFAVLLGFIADSLGTTRAMLFGQICEIPIILIYLSLFLNARRMAQMKEKIEPYRAVK